MAGRRAFRHRISDALSGWAEKLLGLEGSAEPVNTITDEDGVVWVDDFESSNVSRFGYNPATATLWIEFHGGRGQSRLYRYPGFPAELFEEMREADSKGQFVWYVVRNSGADDRDYERVG